MKRASLWASTVLVALLSACGGDETKQSLQTGQFIDDPVSGLAYSCVNGTQTNSGITNELGQFSYQAGQTCTFKVGQITLGTLSSIPSDGKVTPQDVAGVTRSATTAPSAVAIAQFLHSLNDGSASGKIVIPAATQTLLANATPVTLVSNTGAISSADLQNLVVNVAHKTLVSANTATAALDTQIAQGNVSTSTGAVSASTRVLNSIVVSSSASSQAAGLNAQWTATGYYSDGTHSDITDAVSWTSSDTQKLTVSSAGLATGLVRGTATVSASLRPAGASAAVVGSAAQTILDPVLQSIAVTHTASPPAGRTDQLRAVGSYSDGTTADLTASVTWSSSDTGKVTLSTNTPGLATGVALGSATITASYTPVGSNTPISGTLSESVLAPTITNLVISYIQAGLSSIQQGATAALQAIVTLSNSATQTVSSLVDWVVAAVSGSSGSGQVVNANDGTANATFTGTAVGDVTISASYLGVNSNSLGMTVTPLTTISGVAASGTAMSGATISAQCQGSTNAQTVTAANDGSYTITLPAGTTSPCILKATSTDAVGVTKSFYSAVASDAGTNNPIANITPLTHLVVTNATGSEPTANTSLQAVASQLSSSSLTAATGVVQTSLSTALGVPSAGLANPLTSNLRVALPDSGKPPSVQDAAIDQVMASLNVSSTSISTLANALSGSSTSVAATSSLQQLASQNGIPTSASGTCPFATSGLYATANVGSTNLRNGFPSFGALKIDFSNNTAVNGSGETFQITQPNSENPCQFRVQSANKYINFQVSRSGFIVATSFDPPAATATSPSLMSAGTGSECFRPNSYCSGFQLGFPVQTGVTLSDLQGSWQSVEWNLDQYTYANNNGSTTPCAGIRGSSSTCSIYVSFARQFNISGQGAIKNMTIYDCDGLGQGGTGRCATTPESNTLLTLRMCSENNDCPTVSYVANGVTRTVSLTSVVDVMSGGSVVGRTLAYRAPNNDLIGFFVAGAGGPITSDFAHTNFGGVEFQEQFGVIFRPAQAALPPVAGSTINNPQWVVSDWGSSIASATITGNTMSNVVLNAGANALTTGQVIYNTGIKAGTTISAVNAGGTYTLACGGDADCRVNALGSSSFTTFMAFGFQIKEVTQVYTVSNVSSTAPYSFNRTFSDAIDLGQVDRVVLDRPYTGMAYRAYAPANGSVPSMNESVSLRGSGFAISIGTATVAQQLGGLTPVSIGTSQAIMTTCTMPGQVITYSNGAYGCNSAGRTTGKFFTVNLKY